MEHAAVGNRGVDNKTILPQHRLAFITAMLDAKSPLHKGRIMTVANLGLRRVEPLIKEFVDKGFLTVHPTGQQTPSPSPKPHFSVKEERRKSLETMRHALDQGSKRGPTSPEPSVSGPDPQPDVGSMEL